MGLLNGLLHIHTYGEANERGYQYCTTCNKAVFIGVPFKEPTYTIVERIEFTDKKGKVYKITFVQKCVETGELKSFSIKS